MSSRDHVPVIVAALGGAAEVGAVFRDAEACVAWVDVVAPPARASKDIRAIRFLLSGSFTHERIVMLAVHAELLLPGIHMAQALARTSPEALAVGAVLELPPESWEHGTPDNPLRFRYRLSAPDTKILSAYQNCVLATGFGPPAYAQRRLALLERSLERLTRLIELQAPRLHRRWRTHVGQETYRRVGRDVGSLRYSRMDAK